MDAIAFSPWFSLTAALGFSLVVLYLALLLGQRLSSSFKKQSTNLIEPIHDLLPKTQCGQCGYAGCLPYAKAIVQGESINKCPPGGKATISSLAALLDQAVIELDPLCGHYTDPAIVVIREAECIGCTKCIQACPVDAILGAAKLMHTVIASECTGCNLCIEPCPVDCIDIIPLQQFHPPRWEAPQRIESSPQAGQIEALT